MRGELDVSGSKGVPFTSVREELDLEGCDLCGHELNVYEEEFNNRPPAFAEVVEHGGKRSSCCVCAPTNPLYMPAATPGLRAER